MSKTDSVPAPRVATAATQPSALRAALIYAVTAAAGILLGDLLISRLSIDKDAFDLLNFLQDVLFVSATTALVYALVRRSFRANAALEQHYHDLFDSAPLGIYRTTPDGRVLAANPALVQMLGYTSLADLQQRNLEAEGLDARYPRQEFRARLERDGYVTGLEAEWLRRDGISIFVRENARATRAPDGTLLYYDGTVEDITGRKQIELALEQERDVLRALLDNTVDTIYFKDTASRFTRINRAQATALGVADPQDAIGNTDLDFFPPELAALMWAEERQIIQTGQPVLSREEYNPTRDGRPRWFSVSKNPLFDQAGHIIGLVGVSRDITAVKLREREFRAVSGQNSQLLAAEREQRTLAEALRDTAAALNSTLNVDEVLDRVLANIERVVPHDIANIMLINDEDGQAVARVARCHGYDRISPELDGAIRQLRFPVMGLANLRQMLETGQPFIISDTHTYPDWLDSPSTQWQRSYVGAPIHLRDSVVGFIQLDSRQINFFTPIAAERLQTFANQAATAIENARLFQAEREQYALAEALRDAANLLSSTLDFDEVLDRILSNVGRIVPNDVATLLLIEHGQARVMRAVGYTDFEREARIRRLRFPIAQTPNLQRVMDTRQPQLVANTATDPAWTAVEGVDWIKSNMVAPMIIKGQVIGILTLDSTTPYFYTPPQAERLQVFATQAAVALENAQLFDEARQRLKELAVLFDSSRAITATLDRATVLRTIPQRLAEAVDATSVYVLSIDLDSASATVLAEYFGPDANDLERESDLGTTYSLIDLPDAIQALRNGQPAITIIDQADAEWVAVKQLRQYGAQSSLRVPMIVAGKVWEYAVIWDSRTPRHWTEAEIQLCQTLANQAAVALENVRLFEAERKQLRLAQTLQAVGALLTAQMSLNEVFDYIFDLLARVVKYDSVSVQLVEDDRLALIAGRGFPDNAVMREIVSEVSRPTLAERWGQPHHRVITLPDTYADPRWIIYPGSEYIRSWIGAALYVKGRLLGILNVDSRTPRAYTEELGDTVAAFANQAAIAIENAQLNEAVRRHADELEERVIARTAELENERKRTAAILDTAGEGIIFTDVNGTIEYVNQALTRLTGYLSAEALGQNPRLWRSGKTSPALYHEMWDTIKRDRIWQGELVNRRKDGELYDAALTIAPLHDADDHIAGFVGVQRDITQRKELERLKDEFVSNVSHELRTPIANVKLYISLLTRGKPDRHDEYLQTLRRESARLENLIENLLDLSRLDLDTAKVELEPVDLNQLTAQLITDRTALAASRQHTVDYQTDERRLLALADPAALSQVFTNLLTNAINYTPPNGLITVSVAYREHAGQTWATITVKDTGPGITPSDLPHLFDRFYRGEAGRKSGAPGTGLGLAISDKIIDRLGGQLTVESQPGHGAAFTVWLKPA